MNADPQWLQSLQQATTYRQLQEAFDQMSLEVAGGGVSAASANLIDEAIRRIEQERIRDQTELAEFNAQYDEFKGDNSGVVGWFKRKLPFTTTRKQDVELRELVSDQQAEILADNFVIARAQMLKESLLPPDAARTGKPSSYYRDRFSAYDSVAKLREFGQAVVEATRECVASDQFLAQVRADIDAFAAARFAEKDDQQLQKSGLDKARSELAQLVKACQDKQKLVTAADDRLRQLVEQELASSSPEFRTLQQQHAQLTSFVEQCDIAQPLLDARTKLLDQLQQKRTTLENIPTKAKAIESKRDKLRKDLEAAQAALQKENDEFQHVQHRYDAAQAAADQMNMRVEATRPLLDAYLQERGLEANSTDPEVSSSPIGVEYASLKAAAATGQTQLQQAKSAYDQADRKRQHAQAECDKIIKIQDDLQVELNKLNQERVSIENDVSGLCDRYRQGKLTFQSTIQAWWNERTAVQWHPALRTIDTHPHDLMEELPVHSVLPTSTMLGGANSFQRIHEACSRFNAQFSQSWKAAKAAQLQLTQDRLTALQQRSRLLLDSELAARLFA